MSLTWASGDVIRVYNHANHNQYDDFTLDEGSDRQQVGTFTGTPTHLVGATSYDVEVFNGEEYFDYNHQTQPADGVTSDLKYFARARDISDYTDIQFVDVAGILAITAKMPEGVAGDIKSIELICNSDPFPGLVNTFTIELENTGDAGDDGILHFYANLDISGTDYSIPLEIVVHFYAPDTEHTVYTRYLEFPQGIAVGMNTLNTININATESDKHAGLTSCDGSTAEKAYLIGDKYQLMAVQELASTTSKTYFKMIDNVDMSGMTDYVPINEDTPDYSKVVDFDGNDKSISYLNKHLFYVLKGSVYDLTLNYSNISTRGILAEYVQGTGHTITNVSVSNGKVEYSGNTVGGLIGRINNGTGTCVTITNCKVSDTEVKGAGSVGGLLGSVEASVIVNNCTYSDGSVTGSSDYTGGLVGSLSSVSSSFDQCSVTNATIYGVNYTGGFIGSVAYANPPVAAEINFTNNTVGGTTTVNGNSAVGGFAGYINTSGNCNNNSTNTSLTVRNINGGGFVGTMQGGMLNHCSAQGSVTATKPDTDNPNAHGGFVGNDLMGVYTYCLAKCVVSSKGYYVGGFTGVSVGGSTYRHCRVQTSKVESTYNNQGSNKKNNSCVGGFLGCTSGAFTGIIEQCWMSNAGSATEIKSVKQRVGGFVGQIGSNSATANTGILRQCRVHRVKMSSAPTNSGIFAGVSYVAIEECCASTCQATTVLNGSSNIGGFVGYQQYYSISNCYVTGGTISAASGKNADKVGGFAGHAQNTTISNCYTTAAIGNLGTGTQIGSFIADGNTSNLYIERCMSTYSADFAYNNAYLSTSGINEVTTSGSIAAKAQSSDYSWSASIWSFGNPPSLINTNTDPMTN